MIKKECVKFQGFTPSDLTFAFLCKKLNAVHEEAPYDSFVCAEFKRKNRFFEGSIQINAQRGKFVATAQGQNIKEMTYRLIEKIHNQIDRWKSQRFVNQAV